MEPPAPAVEAWSLNHWTAREVPHSTSFHFSFLSCLWFYLRANAFCPPLPLATACASGVLGALLLLALLVLPPGHWLKGKALVTCRKAIVFGITWVITTLLGQQSELHDEH